MACVAVRSLLVEKLHMPAVQVLDTGRRLLLCWPCSSSAQQVRLSRAQSCSHAYCLWPCASGAKDEVTPEDRSVLHTVGAAGLVAFVDVYDSLENAAK
jgi:hypothetical protein